MKTIFVILMLGFIYSGLNAQTQKISKIPGSVEEFVQMRNKIATTPEGGAAMFLIGMKLYTKNPELAKKCFVTIVDRNLLRKGNTYKGYQLLNSDLSLIKSQLGNNKNLPNSYIKGATPDKHYKANLPYEYEFSTNPYSGTVESGNIKLFVKCSGAASPRPMTMKKNNRGIWKISNWSSVLVGIQKPPVDDDL